MREKLSKRGQGVIEYAGAIVIASVLVGAILMVGPTGISNLFSTILTATSSMLTGHLTQLS